MELVMEKCINIGTVFNSRSNNAGGVLAYWLSYGGTLTNCYNFGEITTNSNNGESSGTVGGVAGYFNNPVAGTAANLYRCSNYGSVKKMTNGANDVGGVFGKVQLANDHNSDAMTINVIECVNGSNVELQAQSMSVGIFCYIGPWAAIPNVEVNIDRCRNYATDVTISLKYNDTNLFAGICGNRGNGSATSASTTVTNCFALYKNTVSTNNAPIAMNRGRENIVAYGNYFMDGNSFEEKKIAALLKLTEGTPSGEATANDGKKYGTSCKNHYNYGTRLYASNPSAVKNAERSES